MSRAARSVRSRSRCRRVGAPARSPFLRIPELREVTAIGREFVRRAPLARRAHDVTARALLERQKDLLEPGALVLVLDAPRDADVVDRRHVDERAPREGHVRRDAHALVRDLVLRDLHDELLPLAEQLVDRRQNRLRGCLALARGGRALGGSRGRLEGRRGAAATEGVEVVHFLSDVGHVQEGVLLEADVHEGRLHAGQDARHAPLVDVSDRAALLPALDLHLGHASLFEDRDARFAFGGGDEKLFRHAGSVRGGFPRRSRNGGTRRTA